MARITTSKGVLTYRPRIIYPGINQIDKHIAFENLKVVAEIMNQSGLKWGPVLGTLLGIVRDNDFITWDEDIDLYVMEEDKENFLPLLFEFQNAGFDVIRNWRGGLVSIMRNGEYIDFYYMKDLGGRVRCAVGDAFIFEKYLTDTIPWDFKGVTLNVPREYDEFLTFHYGDWRTPVQWLDYEMNAFRRFKLKLLILIKNHLLPDCIYYPLFRKTHQARLDRFLAKCSRKGVVLDGKVSLDAYKA